MTEQELRTALDEKVEKCWNAYKESVCDRSADWMFGNAEEIAARRLCYNQLIGGSLEGRNLEHIEYLLQFEDPLEVVSDFWLDAQAVDYTDEFDSTLWTVYGKSAAEQGYALDPNYSPPERGQTMC